MDKKKEENRALGLAIELIDFISDHLSKGMIATERDGKDYAWYVPMQDGTLASFKNEIEELAGGNVVKSVEEPNIVCPVCNGDGFLVIFGDENSY